MHTSTEENDPNITNNTHTKPFVAKESLAWLLVFVPALSYYLQMILNDDDSSSYQYLLTGVLSLTTVPYLCHNSSFCSQNNMVINLQTLVRNHTKITGLTWVNDEELGRGYLLYSDLVENRIWRWERGGGPLSIGRTLRMERSGCRFNHTHCKSFSTHSNPLGSAGLLVDEYHNTHNNAAALIVAEYGEQQVVYINNGIRLPLVTSTQTPHSLVLAPPFGDALIFTDAHSGNIYRVDYKPPINNLSATTITAMPTKKCFLCNTSGKNSILRRAMGLAISTDLKSIYVTGQLDHYHSSNSGSNGTCALLKIALGDEKEDENNENDEALNHKLIDDVVPDNFQQQQPFDVIFDCTDTNYDKFEGIAIDRKTNHIWIAAGHKGVLVINEDGKPVMEVPSVNINNNVSDNDLGSSYVTDVTFGDKDYVYISSETALLRTKLI